MTMLLLISACGGDGTPEEIIEENAAKIISTSNKLISIDVGTGFQFQSPRPDSEQYCKNFRDKLEIIENENSHNTRRKASIYKSSVSKS